MLTTETKQRINTARDVLVGKVPDPKSQVEQITIAMIYKFMDDMDKEAIEFGGEPTFFAGEFDKYAWSKLFDPRLGGAEVLALYAEAIVRMNHNPNIPQLFRDIFKNAFLPYRDPETLKLFLKTINGFAYDHSEDLGDAFEYLLQVMGSQGDAGQFRTPRHIIDFMVAVVQPQKHETIADPACGTAGFLVSAYNYIRNQNTDKQRGDLLTPSDRQNIVKNVRGYDISPDMVRLSLVNLYLHGFTNPQVLEYDTLTSEDRWNEYFDVILANPPFMSPKGGIKPHRRFSIQSSRSEVLFLDYIAEHLRPGGRAAVIVPEGVIFQSGTAYKSLRKLLVDKYLWAVVSLPAGVFQPYSGVKTSILLLDRTLAPKTDSVLFVKVKADGYDLGAQRRTVVQNDLPNAQNLLSAYRKHVLAGGSVSATGEFVVNDDLGLVVEKERIIGTGEYYLSGERYRRILDNGGTSVQLTDIGQIFEKVSDTVDPQHLLGNVNYIGLENIESQTGRLTGIYQHDPLTIKSLKTRFRAGDILYGKLRPNLNKVWLATFDGICSTDIYVFRPKSAEVLSTYYEHVFRVKTFNDEVIKGLNGSQLPRVSFEYLSSIEIPLPPLSVQQQIVAEIEGYQRIIDGARQVVDAYKPQIQIDPSWEMVEIGDVCEVTSSKRIFQEEYVDKGVPFYRTKEIVELNRGHEISLELFISQDKYDEIKQKFDVPHKGHVLISAVGTIGVTYIIPDNREFYFKDGNILWLKDLKGIEPEYLKLMLDVTVKSNLHLLINGAAYNALTIVKLKTLQIPLPPLKTQQRIVAAIEREQALVNANKELIQLFGQKIKDRIAAVWGRADVPEVSTEETVVRAMPYAPIGGELAMVAEEQV